MANISLNPRYAFLAQLVLAVAAALACLPPVPQDTAYHAFADTLTRFGLANERNVVSNAAFLAAGIVGLRRVLRHGAFPGRAMWLFFFAAVILVGFGSAWYHHRPANASLVWDRLPMTLAFASLTACLVAERISLRAGRAIFVPLLLAGAGSVLYWWAGEQAGAGDLRPYILIQYLPMLLVPYFLLAFPRGAAADRPYWLLLAGYALAKMLELGDAAVFALTAQLASGHTLKHTAAAVAILLFRPQFPTATQAAPSLPPFLRRLAAGR